MLFLNLNQESTQRCLISFSWSERILAFWISFLGISSAAFHPIFPSDRCERTFLINIRYHEECNIKNVQLVTNASHTDCAVWLDTNVTELNFVSISTTRSVLFPIHIRLNGLLWLKSIKEGGCETRKRCSGALNIWQVSHTSGTTSNGCRVSSSIW